MSLSLSRKKAFILWKWAIRVFLFQIFLHALDLLTTIWAISTNGLEANAMVGRLLLFSTGYRVAGFILFKILVISVAVITLVALRELTVLYPQRQVSWLIGAWAIVLLPTIALLLVVLGNLYVAAAP